MKPLEGIRVIDFSQFLAGPACGLRLADLGAEVIKIERPGSGDICRTLYVSNQKVGSESTIFHAINRNKKSIALDLKKATDLEQIYQLISEADVVIQNFRPGVAERLGIGYESLTAVNPKLIYGTVSGYGRKNTQWLHSPGQDLLAQSRAGMMWHSGHSTPSPMGLSIGDMTAAYDLTIGILSLLVRRGITGQGGLVEVSLIESLLNLQAAEITNWINGDHATSSPVRPADLIYATADGFIAVSNADCIQYKKDAFSHLNSDEAISQLESQSVSAIKVLNLKELRASEHYQQLQFEQTVTTRDGIPVGTTRCPIKIDGQLFKSHTGAPAVGEHNYLLRN